MSAPKRYLKKCAFCGKEFEGTQISLYSSRHCCDKAKYKPKTFEPKICPGCKKEFTPRRSSQKSCSEACAKLVERWRRRDARRSELANMIRTCPTCGKEFTPRERRQTYCSSECRRNRFKRRGSGDEMTANGLSMARLREIARLQAVGGPALYKHSLTWSQAERNWAAAYHLKHHPMRDIHHNY